jgi:membrane protease YdiL (CAAX protease family)
MSSYAVRSQMFASSCIFVLWAILRFYLMMQIRGLIFHNIQTTDSIGLLINHGLIVLEALILFVPFYILQRMNLISNFQILGNTRNSLPMGIWLGFLIFALTIPVAMYFKMKYSFQFSFVEVAGNIFSNGAEEMIYRGILLAAAASLFKKSWVSICISAFAFGFGHWDLPYLFQAYIVVVGILLAWAYLRTKSLIAPYVAHTVADILADSFFH